MHIIEVIDTLPIGVLPCSYYVLKNATDVQSCHEKLKIPLRHPFSIYSVSLSTIREKMDGLLDLIVPLYAEPQALEKQYTKLDTAIREATDSLLDALMEHFDDCENVLDCYLDKESQKQKKKIIAKWKSYRDHVGKIVNRIKHQQRRVRTIVFHGTNWAVPGYFIEGPVPGKMIGPDPLIHPGGETAFSFRRNLLFHLWGLYDTSRCLSEGLSMINKRFANTPTPTTTEKGEEEWYKMIRRVESLNPLVFPDEARKQNIVVTVKDGRLRVEYSSKDKAHSVPSPSIITVLHVVDGMSPSFRAPYHPKN